MARRLGLGPLVFAGLALLGACDSAPADAPSSTAPTTVLLRSPIPSPESILFAWKQEMAEPASAWATAFTADYMQPYCPTSPLVPIRDDIAPGVGAGPVHFTFYDPYRIPKPVAPAKVLIVVDREAGQEVRMKSRTLEGSGTLLFYYHEGGAYNVPPGQYVVPTLTLVGPFSQDWDAARGYFLPSGPGCYEVTITWDTGSGTVVIEFAPGR